MLNITSFLNSIIYRNPIKKKFTKIYKNNLFKGTQSKSGQGSNIIQTKVIRNEIPILLKKLKAKSIIDAPCGDFFWMKEVDLSDYKYIGIDIVGEIIKSNQTQYESQNITFIEMNIIEHLTPTVDLILCRDCLVHLSFEDSINIIKNFRKSGSKYLLATTFTERLNNNDLGRGFWRPLNLQMPPFNFPKPIHIINENCTEDNGRYSDKSLGLWALTDIHFNK
jgi:hypothetical protein